MAPLRKLLYFLSSSTNCTLLQLSKKADDTTVYAYQKYEHNRIKEKLRKEKKRKKNRNNVTTEKTKRKKENNESDQREFKEKIMSII